MVALKFLLGVAAAGGAILALGAAQHSPALSHVSPGLWEIAGIPGAKSPLRECVAEAKSSESQQLPHLDERLEAMLEFMELTDSWGERAAKLAPKNLRRLAKLGDSIFKLAE